MRRMNIVLIEDNNELCTAIEELLTLCGYAVRSFLCAIDLVTADLDPDDIDAVVADYSLPDGNGVEAVQHLREARPDLPVLVMTATARQADTIAKLRHCRLLPKPLDFERLLGELARIRMRKVGLRAIMGACAPSPLSTSALT
jgi:DNA-binding NtrC family response regulator